MLTSIGGAFAIGGRVTSILRGILISLLLRIGGGRCGTGLRVERGFRMRQGYHQGIELGSNVYLGKDVTFDCPRGGSLKIGSNVILTQGIFISAISSVEIGSDSLIGEYSSLRDANHGILPEILIRLQQLNPSPISVGRDVWIGRGCAILAGVAIGDGAVIGANSVVTHNIDSQNIAVGSPARPIGRRD